MNSQLSAPNGSFGYHCTKYLLFLRHPRHVFFLPGELVGREERIHAGDAAGTANTLYSGTRTIHSEQITANSYRLRDYTRGAGIVTLKADKTDYTDRKSV